MKLNKLGKDIFDFYPTDYLVDNRQQLTYEQLKQLTEKIQVIKSSTLFDTSGLQEGDRVISPLGRGIVTNYHNTDKGKLNMGFEVLISGKPHYFYPNQLRLNIDIETYIAKRNHDQINSNM